MPPSMESSSFFIDGAWKPHLPHMDIVAWDSVILVNKPRFFSSHLALDWKDFSGSPYKITIAKSKLFVYCLCLCLENTEFCLRANILKKKKKKEFLFQKDNCFPYVFQPRSLLGYSTQIYQTTSWLGKLARKRGKTKEKNPGAALPPVYTRLCVWGGVGGQGQGYKTLRGQLSSWLMDGL